ncbi:Crp/Fnr family transcriptional regulator [Flavilitoribacter nigricans]|uniref:Cyclic nucleotide-binding domain-containing protein n=1 Tax=Flavilitoribacter nigricans (strain ATCC 23147 / DSM 23189 / NBRC 102662 / NCIMB 1420 / SS-2) TaxID=1122177 RepID=A0A2D0N732_FLAN2|nr:Crp/Fnr family transcriptional regulator [Flavilitoribacter nigricans]PHN04208.1 hypothetical protein CRP01_21840 [Flavilitoribacter nigricans DSM 23189 = NBRC 102662]
MSPEEIQKNLRRYINISLEEAEQFLSLFETVRYKNRKVVVESGDYCRYFFLVEEGCLMTYYTDGNGFEHVLQFATHMWWSGDLPSLMNNVPSAYSIKAIGDTSLLQISKPNLDRLYRELPKFERYYRIIFQNALVAHQRRIIQNIAYTAEERYLQFREAYPQVELLVPQKYIASYLGITPEFLSKIRRRLSNRK